jgi:hypothetical protein
VRGGRGKRLRGGKKEEGKKDRSRGKGSGREAIFADSGFVPGVRKNGGPSRRGTENDAAGSGAELSPHGISFGR